jgi:hypothetical protein
LCFKTEINIKQSIYLKKLNKIKNNNEMANKNIEDSFGEKKRDKSKCKNILDLEFVEETASDSPTEKLSDDEKFENNKITNSSLNKKSDHSYGALRSYTLGRIR